MKPRSFLEPCNTFLSFLGCSIQRTTEPVCYLFDYKTTENIVQQTLHSTLETTIQHHIEHRVFTISIQDAIIPLKGITCTTTTPSQCIANVSSLSISVVGPPLAKNLKNHLKWSHYRATNTTVDVMISQEVKQKMSIFTVEPSETISTTGQNADMFKLAVCLGSLTKRLPVECSTLIVNFVLKQKLPFTCQAHSLNLLVSPW